MRRPAAVEFPAAGIGPPAHGRACREGGSAMSRRPRGDGGTAVIEFVGLSVVLLLPVVYVLLTVFQLQRAAFGVSQAAREAGRAYATATSSGLADDRAREA